MITTISLSGAQVTQLVELLSVVAAAADTSDEDRYQLHYSRSQVGQLMPGVEVLVLAGVLADMTDRPGPDLATRNACRMWSSELARLLSVASAATPPSAVSAARASPSRVRSSQNQSPTLAGSKIALTTALEKGSAPLPNQIAHSPMNPTERRAGVSGIRARRPSRRSASG